MIRSRTIPKLALIALLALGALFTSQPVYAASFTVTTTLDQPDANPGDGMCATSAGTCTLRAAIMEANALAGADTITLPADTFTLTIAGQGEDAAAMGDLDVSSEITIAGAGADATIIQAGTISSNGIDRVFEVLVGATLRVTGVTVQHGSSPSGDVGGGIRNRGTLALTNSSIKANRAATGAGLHSTGALTLVNSTMSSNLAQFAGGGLVTLGTATITNSTISGNQSGATGGGIDAGGTVTITNSTISGNQANGSGGGIYGLSTITLINSTMSGNRSNASGGGIFYGGTATLINTTIANNVADADANGTGNGGGIFNFGANGMVNLRHTLIGNNTKGDATVKSECSTVNPLISQGYNLIESTDGCPITGDTTGNITGIDPQLSPLADNGGPTQTHALLAGGTSGGSPAIDAGDPAGCKAADGTALATDQRGIARPQGARCDIGAFELEVAAPITNTVYVPLVVK